MTDSPARPKPIVTLTLNPSLDVGYEVSRLLPDEKVQASHVRYDAGGNGINVSRALITLGVPASTCCILAGPIGEAVRQLLDGKVGRLQVVQVDGRTRVSCTFLEEAPRIQYEVTGIGPAVPPAALEELSSALVAASAGEIGVLTGSAPPGVPDSVYGDLVDKLRARGSKVVVDAHGPLLKAAVGHRPLLIKPNRWELQNLCGKPLPTLEAVAAAARDLHESGIAHVCVSLGAEGAILVSKGDTLYGRAPEIAVRSTVGAGDSMVAGLVAAFAAEMPPAEALRLALACGSGTAGKPGTQLFDRADLDDLLVRIAVEKRAG